MWGPQGPVKGGPCTLLWHSRFYWIRTWVSKELCRSAGAETLVWCTDSIKRRKSSVSLPFSRRRRRRRSVKNIPLKFVTSTQNPQMFSLFWFLIINCTTLGVILIHDGGFHQVSYETPTLILGDHVVFHHQSYYIFFCKEKQSHLNFLWLCFCWIKHVWGEKYKNLLTYYMYTLYIHDYINLF